MTDNIERNEGTEIEPADSKPKRQSRRAAILAKGAKAVAATAAKKAASAAQDGIGTAKEGLGTARVAVGEGALAVKERLYSPVFPEEFNAPNYDTPDLIVLVDGDQRKGIDVCEGAIGWFSKEKKMEVLHLYMEYAEECRLDFFPSIKCDAAYYVDSYDKTRYIDIAEYVETMKRDAFTELRRVAYELGAKRCRLESFEATSETESTKGKRKARAKLIVPNPNIGKVEAGVETQAESARSAYHERSIVFEQEYDGNAKPIRPELCRLKNDREIEFLIDTRCNAVDTNVAKTYNLKLSTSSTVSISESMAKKIDTIVKSVGLSTSSSLNKSVTREMRSELYFTVEF